jgi:hypothetical protein
MLQGWTMRHSTQPSFGFAAMLRGNPLFETAVCTLGMGRPAARGLLVDALRHAGVDPRIVSCSQMLLLLPEIERSLASLTGAPLAAERVMSLSRYLDRTAASAA